MIDRIVALTSRRSLPVSELARRLHTTPEKIAKEVKGHGLIRVRDGVVTAKPTVGAQGLVTLGNISAGRHSVAVATDLHFGSRHTHAQGLVKFLRYARDVRGCKFVVCTGDILDGNKPVLLPDQDEIGFDHQSKRAVDTIAKVSGMTWVAIDGNHDGYFSASCGFVSGLVLANRMSEAGIPWHFAGVCLGEAKIYGAHWKMWHPHGGADTRNAVRRVLNARVEADPRGDILAIGHFHKFVSLPVYPESIHGIAGGTFQRKLSEFANRITRPWDVGGSIVTYTTDAKGAVSEVSADFVPCT